MPCEKCNGLMSPTVIYTDSSTAINAMRCMNCGRYEYAPPELRVIPVEDYKKHRRCGNGNRTVKESTCKYCSKEYKGYRYKYCSRKCQNAVTNRNARLQRLKAKEMT